MHSSRASLQVVDGNLEGFTEAQRGPRSSSGLDVCFSPREQYTVHYFRGSKTCFRLLERFRRIHVARRSRLIIKMLRETLSQNIILHGIQQYFLKDQSFLTHLHSKERRYAHGDLSVFLLSV